MSVHAGPNTIEDGLVLCLDAANLKSYPGTGTTWTNTIGSPNITLSSTGFTSEAQGGIVFSSSSSSAAFPSTGFNLSNGFTISVWIKHTGTLPRTVGSVQRYFTIPSEAAVLRFENNNILRGYCFDTTGTIRSISVSTQIVSNTYYNCVFSYDNSVFRLYKNEVEIGNLSVSVTLRTPSGSANLPSGGSEWFEGNMYYTQFYNRALSATEISQNFNALRGRYGI